MRLLAGSLIVLTLLAPGQPHATESLGTVNFRISCTAAVRAPFNRGVALMHDFWYDEAERQFKKVAERDPACAIAHWGIALSTYQQIWDRPDEDTMAKGWQEMQKALKPPAKTARERAYIAAASRFFRPGKEDYQSRVDAYSSAMGELYRRYPADTDAGAFYALSLLAAETPHDTSLGQERKALEVLNPLFGKYPDHPGVVHYIIHACDTPSLASQGLAAARHYGEIAPSGAHALHMPGHIFARLGMWPEDIRDNLASVTASHEAEARHESDGMDQFHSDDFLMYAYLQSGQDNLAKQVVDDAAAAMAIHEAMPDMIAPYMRPMFPYYRNHFPAFYYLEMRDWEAAATLEPVTTGPPETQMATYWARTVADGHLRRPQQAHADYQSYLSLLEEVKRGKNAYYAESTGAEISRGEMSAWVAFADSDEAGALKFMRDSADLQDKVGQGEVAIPAREMLADMLLEFQHPDEALVEYQRALELSPNRFNGLFNAGLAAEAAGDHAKAAEFYAALLKSSGAGGSARPELEHARNFVSTAKVASE